MNILGYIVLVLCLGTLGAYAIYASILADNKFMFFYTLASLGIITGIMTGLINDTRR